MIHSVYKCEDFEFRNGVLTIWDAKEVAKVRTVDDFNLVSNIVEYNAIVCPGLLDKADEVRLILFE